MSLALSNLAARDRYQGIDVLKVYEFWGQSLSDGANRAIKAIASGEPISKQLLIGIAGQPRNLRSAGWYCAIISDKHDDEWFRAYVGQSENVGRRIRQHYEIVKQDSTSSTSVKSLLYHVWRKPGRDATFVHLGTFKNFSGNNEYDKLRLNICEQLFAEKLQTLQLPFLRQEFPQKTFHGLGFGLNVALPINQIHKSADAQLLRDTTAAYRTAFNALRTHPDYEVREYYDNAHHIFTPEQQAKGRQTMTEQQHIQQIHGARQSGQARTTHLQREPVDESEEIVEVYCMKCRNQITRHVDPAPLYETATNLYVARRAPCINCPRPTPTKKSREVMIPVDTTISYVRWNWLGKDINRNDPRWEHKR